MSNPNQNSFAGFHRRTLQNMSNHPQGTPPRCPVCNSADDTACREAGHISTCERCGSDFVSLVYPNCINCHNWDAYEGQPQHQAEIQHQGMMQSINRPASEGATPNEEPLFGEGPSTRNIPRPSRMGDYVLLETVARAMLSDPQAAGYPVTAQHIADSEGLRRVAESLMQGANGYLGFREAKAVYDWLEDYRERMLDVGTQARTARMKREMAAWLDRFLGELKAVWEGREEEMREDVVGAGGRTEEEINQLVQEDLDQMSLADPVDEVDEMEE
ncbi:hypothetical protein BJY04DRAFT_219043 [Aspergillus karnatakaensis]|uniref:uncharacterized protein n=1 Tax=Aspergillus karnatakaensis TaxID=1810916 RepID=UPI003CCCAB31